jgi:molybdopterin converting factor small subunit
VEAVLRRLSEDFPLFAEMQQSVLVARECEYLELNASVQDGDELHVMPPLSGG